MNGSKSSYPETIREWFLPVVLYLQMEKVQVVKVVGIASYGSLNRYLRPRRYISH